MEELRSTEILDREIHEDARKKAEKVLKAAERECERIQSETEARIAAAGQEKKKDYEKKLEAYRQDAESSIPLEKQRRFVSLIDSSVRKALVEWFEGIGKERRLALYRSKLERYVPNLGTARIRVREIGYAESEIAELVEKTVGTGRLTGVTLISEAQSRVEGVVDGLIVETEDRSVLCRVTRAELFAELLSEKRQELAEALFGGRLSE